MKKAKFFENIYNEVKRIVKAKYPKMFVDWNIYEGQLILMFDEGSLYTGISFFRKYLIRNNHFIEDIIFFINEIDSLFEEMGEGDNLFLSR